MVFPWLGGLSVFYLEHILFNAKRFQVIIYCNTFLVVPIIANYVSFFNVRTRSTLECDLSSVSLSVFKLFEAICKITWSGVSCIAGFI